MKGNGGHWWHQTDQRGYLAKWFQNRVKEGKDLWEWFSNGSKRSRKFQEEEFTIWSSGGAAIKGWLIIRVPRGRRLSVQYSLTLTNKAPVENRHSRKHQISLLCIGRQQRLCSRALSAHHPALCSSCQPIRKRFRSYGNGLFQMHPSKKFLLVPFGQRPGLPI